MTDQRANAASGGPMPAAAEDVAAEGAAPDTAALSAVADGAAVGPGPEPGQGKGKGKGKRKKKPAKALEDHRVYEAGAVIVCDGKVVLRLTDKQRWIFPKGKLKKHESPRDAAVREAVEETGLDVAVVDEVADLLIKHEGKKRRFVFFLMRATAKTWDWPHHDGRDTFLLAPDRVHDLLRHEGYARVWAACEARARALCDEPTPVAIQRPGA